MIEGMDQAIGRVLGRLDDPNGDGDRSDSIAANTLVFFISDNGGFEGSTHNRPLRGGKRAVMGASDVLLLERAKDSLLIVARNADTGVTHRKSESDSFCIARRHAGIVIPL